MMKRLSHRFNAWDVAAGLLFAVVVVLILCNLSSFQSNIDMPYHLATTQGFIKSGGVTTWDWWDSAPAGRTQLYPPFLHILMSIPLKLGLSVETVGVGVGLMMFPLLMLSLWWMVRQLFSSRQAFYTLLCLLIPYAFFWQTSITSAASLVMILTPLVFLALEKKRWVTPAILLAVCLYSHLVMGHLLALALFIYMLHRRDNWRLVMKILVAAYLLYLPWGIHILANFSRFSVSEPGGGGTSIHLFIWLLALAALPLCYLKKGRYYLMPAYLLSMVPIVFFYSNRFWEGHVFLPLAMLGGVLLTTLHDGLSNLFGSMPEFTYRKKMLAGVCLGLVIIPLLLIDPVISFGSGSGSAGGPGGAMPGAAPPGGNARYVQALQGQYAPPALPATQGQAAGPMAAPGGPGPVGARGSGLRVSAETTTPIRLLQGEGNNSGFNQDPMFSDTNLELFAAIDAVAGENDLVYLSDSGHLNDLVFAETGRGVFSGMFHEVQPSEQGDPASQARVIVVASGNASGIAQGGPGAMGPGGGMQAGSTTIDTSQLELVAQVDGYNIYLNPAAEGEIRVAKAALPFWAIYLIVGLAALLILLDQYLYLRRKKTGGPAADRPVGTKEALAELTGKTGEAPLMVAIPCLNEGRNIGRVVREIEQCEPAAAVLVIDDGSRDSTADEARRAGAVVIVNRRNRGIGACLASSFELALAAGFAILVRADGDGQHDPAHLADLAAPLRDGQADVAIGSRYLDRKMEAADCSTTPLRRKSRKVFSLLIRLYTGRRFSDPNSGYCAYSRPAMRHLAEQGLCDFPESEMLIALQRAGFRVLEVPVRMRPRRAGKSSVRPWKALGYLLALCFGPIFEGRKM